MARRHKIGFVIVSVFCILLLSGCDRLQRWDDKVGEVFFSGEQLATTSPFWGDLGSTVKDKVASATKSIIKKVDIKEFAKDMSKEQKDKIEAWLKKEGKNRYGDPEGTYYNGGTPLFNETTGETKERFEYILKNHKELIDLVDSE